ncbi:tripartite tricarboxylate transporter substrate binding protein [Alkalihalophilus lindianensis]|uniref:Tripartite tricarboxylate transporter substrate binding protein n=1 Tax=Alkalihalophilus lindianensis TaxID=1630542 RepID=A0ABU3X4R7_9BACI|nr:tripartite tricarboxylate transporter substrate binding protein [Alkalihalophilus lindianensis]MDV2682879.1 tripartite tricarboxylate transporter substrate binding protein [Alkalihalophilus lindianensis]
MMKGYLKPILMMLAVWFLSALIVGCSSEGGSGEASNSTDNGAEGSSAENVEGAVDYPTGPVTVVVPAGAGGDTDINARTFAKYLEQELGQPVVISNVTGAGGTVGAREVLDADADGQTVLFFHNSLLLNKILGLVDFSYDDYKLAGISILDEGNTFMVSGDSQFEDLQDLVDYARENPNEVSIATEVGGFTHLQLLALEQDQDIELNIVDVGGAADKIAALLGGHIDIVPTSLGLVKEYVESGDMRTLGIMAEETADLMPEVPTFKEQGVNSSFEKFFFFGFPSDTPDEVVEKFSSAMETVINNEEYRAEAEQYLVSPTYMNPEETAIYMQEAEAYYEELYEQE